MKEDQNNSTGPDDPSAMGVDTAKIKILEEIESLLTIPGVQEYFFRAVLEARHIFHEKIKDYELHEVKNKSGKKEAEDTSKKNMTYFFEMKKNEDPETSPDSIWVLDKCKLPPDAKDIKMVLNDFKTKVDHYEIAPHRIQDEPFQLQPLDKWFNIRFTKSSPTRVVGFVKEAEEAREKAKEKQKEEEEKRFVIKRNGSMVKLSTSAKRNLEKKEIEELMQDYPEYTDNMVFSIEMKRQSEFPN
jgi:hypothetical protein